MVDLIIYSLSDFNPELQKFIIASLAAIGMAGMRHLSHALFINLLVTSHKSNFYHLQLYMDQKEQLALIADYGDIMSPNILAQIVRANGYVYDNLQLGQLCLSKLNFLIGKSQLLTGELEFYLIHQALISGLDPSVVFHTVDLLHTFQKALL